MTDRWHVRWIESTGSTNDDLVHAANLGAPDHLVLIADHQTAGRGRLDRRWEAPPGANLLVSILFRSVPDRPHLLTQAVAVAALRACLNLGNSADSSMELSLKWPNDILIGHRKLAGILATASSARRVVTVDGVDVSIPEHIVVGLGLNVRWAPQDAVRLAEFVGDVHRDDVLAGFLTALDAVSVLGADELHEVYRDQLSTLGRVVRAELPSGEILQGRALDVGVDGRLEILDSCAVTHRIDVADVIHLRMSED